MALLVLYNYEYCHNVGIGILQLLQMSFEKGLPGLRRAVAAD